MFIVYLTAQALSIVKIRTGLENLFILGIINFPFLSMGYAGYIGSQKELTSPILIFAIYLWFLFE